MFAGQFAAWTATLDCEGREFYAHLVERTPLALTPERLRALSQVLPIFGIGKLLASRGRTSIGSHRENLVGGKFYTHLYPLSQFLCT